MTPKDRKELQRKIIRARSLVLQAKELLSDARQEAGDAWGRSFDSPRRLLGDVMPTLTQLHDRIGAFESVDAENAYWDAVVEREATP